MPTVSVMAKKPRARKTKELTGRLNLVEKPEELARWATVAEAKGVSLSAWVRMVCREKASEIAGQE